MKKLRLVVLAIIATAALVLSGCGGGAGAEGGPKKVTLTFLTAFPEKGENNDGFWIFRDILKEKAPWIEIDYRGGPEVVKPTDMIEGVSTGAYDGAHLPGDYYTGQMPLMELQRFTPYTPMQERENGVYDLLASAHEKLGVHYLGHTHAAVPQVILLKDKIDSADLSGKQIRASSAASDMVAQLGGSPVEMDGSDVFSALERGVIDGTVWASVGPTSFGFESQVKYYVEPRWYESVANTVINADKWDSLDEETQNALNEAMIEAEPKIVEHYQGLTATETAKWEDAGVQKIELSPEDEKKMLEIAYISAWDRLDWERIVSGSPEAEELKAKYQEGYGDDLTKAVPGKSHIEAAK